MMIELIFGVLVILVVVCIALWSLDAVDIGELVSGILRLLIAVLSMAAAAVLLIASRLWRAVKAKP